MKKQPLFSHLDEHTGGVDGHAINCTCNHCTGGDHYLKRLKGNVGKTAYFSGLPARVGAYGTRYLRDNADSAVQPIALTPPAQTVAPKSGNSDVLNLLKDLGLSALGSLMDKQAAGQLTDPTLEKIGALGNQISQAGVNAGVAQANTTVGENVIKFSPYIIGGVLLMLGLVIYLAARK